MPWSTSRRRNFTTFITTTVMNINVAYSPRRPIHTADVDATQLSSSVASRCVYAARNSCCSSDSSQHDRGSRFPGRCCPRMEQPTAVCHVSDVTVDFQATLKDVLVCDVVLMALTFTPLPVLPSNEHVAVFFVFVCYVSLKFSD